MHPATSPERESNPRGEPRQLLAFGPPPRQAVQGTNLTTDRRVRVMTHQGPARRRTSRASRFGSSEFESRPDRAPNPLVSIGLSPVASMAPRIGQYGRRFDLRGLA